MEWSKDEVMAVSGLRGVLLGRFGGQQKARPSRNRQPRWYRKLRKNFEEAFTIPGEDVGGCFRLVVVW